MNVDLGQEGALGPQPWGGHRRGPRAKLLRPQSSLEESASRCPLNNSDAITQLCSLLAIHRLRKVRGMTGDSSHKNHGGYTCAAFGHINPNLPLTHEAQMLCTTVKASLQTPDCSARIKPLTD